MAKSIVHQDQAPGPPLSDNLPWCICNHYRPMEHATENVCCRQYNCITLSTTFDRVALDRSVLSVAIISHSDLFANDPEYSPANYQKATYRQLIMIVLAVAVEKLSLHMWYGRLEMNIQLQMETI